jgi:glycosyltransferase involved in cell wall biosynthesis
MKILHLMPYSPVPPNFGGALRVYHILRLLARNHEITVLTFGNAQNKKELESHFGDRVKDIHVIEKPWTRKYKRIGQLYSLLSKHSFFYMMARHSLMQNKLDELCDNNKYDITLTEFSHTASYEMKTDAVKIMDAHNVEYEIFRRMWLNAHSPLRQFYYKNEYKKFYHEEMIAIRRHNSILVTSENDKNILDQEVPEVQKHVIPNGVDAGYFTPTNEKREPHSLVFTGAMSYIPNSDGMIHFLDTTFPLIQKAIPDIKLYIVGNHPPKTLINRASHNVIVTGFVDDVRPFIDRSSAYIVPLRMGSGTRLKVLEAMAMRIPIVTTSMGCEGIDVVDNESVLIGYEPQTFAESVIKLLNNKSLQRTLTDNGFELMKSHYEWSVIGDKLEHTLHTLVSNKKNKLEFAHQTITDKQ